MKIIYLLAIISSSFLFSCSKNTAISAEVKAEANKVKAEVNKKETEDHEEEIIEAEEKPIEFKGSYKVKGTKYKILKSADNFSEMGHASWYGPGFHGKLTANGEHYDMNALTAAHRSLPFNTVVKVTNLNNGKYVNVRINDRGPFHNHRVIDLSKKAANKIDILKSGTSMVRIEVLGVNNTEK